VATYSEKAEKATGLHLSDAHFHLGFVSNPVDFAAKAQRAEVPVFAASVTPGEYCDTKGALCSAADPLRPVGDSASIKLAVGLHPWWVSADERHLAEELRAFDGALAETQYVGEVGLDFSKRRIATYDAQLRAFRHIANACAKGGGKVLSVHCVKAYGDVLGILDSSGCFVSCTCIFHWFSGSFQQLEQAVDAGCFFSVGAHMLETKKGREYAKAIPLQKLLLETDAPAAIDPEREHPSVLYSYDQMRLQLIETLKRLARIRGIGESELAAIVQQNACEVFC
jgi:TatD DNase family protein